MNNTAGMTQAEMTALLMGLVPTNPSRAQRRRRVVGHLHAEDNKPKFDRRSRRAKNRDARRSRAKLRAKNKR